VSPDQKTVSAHDVLSGAVVWRHALHGPCVVPPLRAGRHLLVPTLSGRVEEIEPTAGTLLGYYQIDQLLTVGGVFDEATSLAYFPADDFCVYALDVAGKTCAGVLYTGHESGSLKVAPSLLHAGRAKGSKTESTLLLLQAAAPSETALRAFALPISDPDQRPLEPGLRLPGRIDFAPHLDADRLAIATDAGSLSVFGYGNARKGFPLFRLFKDD